MKYSDLISFEPIESVKQLTASGSKTQAEDDVRTYVISQAMRDQLTSVVFPNLRFDNPEHDHKGLLLIATYGTGKTHLLSVISSVAEDASLTSRLTDEETAAAAQAIAGQFKVIRVEIGSTTMPLRDILTTELTEGLSALGVNYTFPSMDEITNNKKPLQAMMAAFEEKYPDHGLLLVVDELLDYLRSRRDAQIILDLAFLREVGEFGRDERFRVIAGLQEALFDNPRFASAQSELRRVQQRYQQFRIARDDVAYVVQKRLLAKTDEQKNVIREHLTRFAPAFESLGSHIEDFVDLFPIHPAYLRTFEALTIVEKRRILESLTAQIRLRLGDELPAKEPGLVCFDAYRADLDGDPSNRTIPDVRDVLNRTRVLRGHLERNLRVASDLEPALRIVDALAIHRLTTDDLDSAIGLTPENLRDDLCLLPPDTPEMDSSFIAQSIEALVHEISTAVSGQYISSNDSNGQVYLDLKKDVDYEAQVNERAATLDEDALDEAYYSALEQLLEVSASRYVAGYRIWSYELSWEPKKVTRPGYLFMGAPNQRSTAEPPRDFYLYFLQPYAPSEFLDELKADEVFLRLETGDEVFETALRRYAAALAMTSTTTSQHRPQFEARATKHFDEMKKWLRDNLAVKLKVTYQGEEKPLAQWLATTQGPRATLKSQIDSLAAQALAPHFVARYPGYPVFAERITKDNRAGNARMALQQIAGRDTNTGKSILGSFELLDATGDIVDSGKYAGELIRTLSAAGTSAVNDTSLLAERDPGVRTWGPWHLEPIWLVVVAAALAYLGRAEIGFAGGQKISATNLDDLTRMSPEDLDRLSYVVTPSGADSAVLASVANLLKVPTALAQGEISNDVTAQFQSRAELEYARASGYKAALLDGPRLWGDEVFDDPAGRIARLDDFLAVAQNVMTRDAPGKLRKLRIEPSALDKARDGRNELARVEGLKQLADRLDQVARYVEAAGNALGVDDPCGSEAALVKAELRDILRAPSVDHNAATRLRERLEELRAKYRTLAVDRHTAARLSAMGDQRKNDLQSGPKWSDLQQLSAVDLLPDGRFGRVEQGLLGLVACKQFQPADYENAFVCPRCRYQPTADSPQSADERLANAEDEVDALWDTWINTVRDSIAAPEIAQGIKELLPEERASVDPLLEDTIAPGDATPLMVTTVNALLTKFTRVPVRSSDLVDAVFPHGPATTLDAAAAAFTKWLAARAESAGDPASVRLVYDQES